MAVDVDSFTDNNIINGTLSHTVTVTPATEISSVTYRVENSTLSNEVSVDEVEYAVDDIETGVNVTLKPHILRHEQTSTGAADIVITITDKYGRSVNVTDHITIMEITNPFTVDSPKLSNLNVASTVDDFNPSDYYLTINASISPQGLVDGNTVNILNSFRGPDVDANNKLIRTEFINNGEFVVTTSQPTQTVPTMTSGTLFVKTANNRGYVNAPIALLSDFLPSTWDEASIFDNLIDTNTFKYKPNNSQLKLYTYNDGWDDRDYIIFNTDDPETARSIILMATAFSSSPNETITRTTGRLVEIAHADSLSGQFAAFRNGLAIPRFKTNTISWSNSGNPRQKLESDFGITYSSSNASSSDKTATSLIYMYATDVSSLFNNGNYFGKNRETIIVINNAYQNNQPATRSEVAVMVSGFYTIKSRS